MGILRDGREMDDLGFQARHPIGGFFAASRYTDFRFNWLLVLIGPVLMVVASLAGAWGWAGFAAVMTVFLVWKFRRYRQRVTAEAAARGRP
ncbi:MAG: hypothetical protein ACE37B_16895 [Ilumatobacter sp.]|jgi:hypothetical protein|uniref:hypothetical protein n=1 Tax=Ilumatobacter sp. TaxID=1967498 RepID=UPI003919840C